MTDYYYLYLFFTIYFFNLDNNNSVALIVIIPGLGFSLTIFKFVFYGSCICLLSTFSSVSVFMFSMCHLVMSCFTVKASLLQCLTLTFLPAFLSPLSITSSSVRIQFPISPQCVYIVLTLFCLLSCCLLRVYETISLLPPCVLVPFSSYPVFIQFG